MDDVIVYLSHVEAHLVHEEFELLVPLLHVFHVRTQVGVHEAEGGVVQVEVDTHTSLVALQGEEERENTMVEYVLEGDGANLYLGIKILIIRTIVLLRIYFVMKLQVSMLDSCLKMDLTSS